MKWLIPAMVAGMVGGILMLLGVLPIGAPQPMPVEPPITARPTSVNTPTPDDTDPRIEQLIESMSLRQKVGQLLMIGFGGTTIEGVGSRIDAYAPGSIVFFQNTTSPEQTISLTRALQQRARDAGAGVPLFIAIDHEGGEIQRLRRGLAYFPSKRVLGATHDPVLARLEGEVEGRELLAMGINMNLGPVFDVDSNPANPIIGRFQRSFGSDPESVARLGVAYLEGLQAQGVLGVAKHFPGHGATATDSHATMPVLDHDWARLHRLELRPFRVALPHAAAVMTAHIKFPALDPQWPASLSPVFVRQLLREELGYDGLVMTDDTGGMAAITGNYTPGAAAVQAIRAGSDMVMVVGDGARQEQAFQALVTAFASGELPTEQLDESVRRILRAKAAYGILDQAVAPDVARVGTAENLAAVRQVTQAAITLVQDPDERVPFIAARAERPLVISASSLPDANAGSRLGEQIRRRRPETTELVFSLTADNSAVFARAIAAARSSDLVVIGTFDAGPWQQGLIRTLEQNGTRPIVIGFGPPYEAARLPSETTYVAAYAPRSDLVDAAVQVLFGEIPARGRLPVAIGNTYPAGHAAQ